ncbi:MAG: hypothetical protein A2162_12465 [Deltaproteobacteria bacterium RBG_13_52_11b]|nr:MAG: hypothetical protein A2162_12465 [Deltaproteobacteria bacterium RBG_13_52_11b]
MFAMSQGIDILKTPRSAPIPDSPLSDDPHFQGFGGETTSIQLRSRLRVTCHIAFASHLGVLIL